MPDLPPCYRCKRRSCGCKHELAVQAEEGSLHCETFTSLFRRLGCDAVPLIVADPPYGIAYHSNHYVGKNPHAPVTHDWNFQISELLQGCAAVLQEGGALYLFCRWDVFPLWAPAIAPAGLKLKTAIAWVKDNWSAGDLEGSFGNQYELILFITKGRHKRRGKRYSNVWPFPRVPAKRMLCPTQKPVELLCRCIEASSDEGDIVVDPVCGSGSTGIAARQTGRKYILGDCDERMAALTAHRLGIAHPALKQGETLPESAANMFYPDMARPEEYGVHPEDWGLVVHQLRQNVSSLGFGDDEEDNHKPQQKEMTFV